jgi:hypothetical protein
LQRVSAYDAAALAALTALVLIAFATYGSYAISNDEPVQQRYGELIIAYYRSGFADNALFHYQNLYLYGGLFDILANLLQAPFPAADVYAVRHILCALTGIGGIAAAWATARMIAGPRAGLIALFALAVCGPWYGAMFNHSKDIPFAAAMIGATYFLLQIARALPRPRAAHVTGFGVLLGCALGMRVLGLLMVGYAALSILLQLPLAQQQRPRNALAFFARSAIALSPAFAIAYVVMIAAWPWAALAPLNPVRGLIDFGGFHYHIGTIFAGRIYEMADVPRWYVPVYLLIKLPPLLLAGGALAIASLIGAAREHRRSETALILFMLLFPVACEVIARGPAFTGMRHFLFVVPLAAVLAGVGFDFVVGALRARFRWLADALAAATGALIAYNAALLVQLHPYQYLYYSPLVGGLPGAAGRYVTDYWVGIMPEAVERLDDYIANLDTIGTNERRYTVAVCGERTAFEEEKSDSRLQWTPDWPKADFFIAPTHMNCDRALEGRTIATISRLGVTIGVVKDRRALVSAQARN